MRQSHLLFLNASIMWVSRVFLLLPQLFLVPYLISTIGETGYGVYALVWSLVMSVDQLQRSLQSGVVKYSAGFLANEQTSEVNRIVSSSFIFSLLLAVLVCFSSMILAKLYNDTAGQFESAFVVVGIMALFVFPLTPYVAVIQSRQRYYIGAIAETASKYFSLLVILAWFNVISPSVEALIAIMAIFLFLSKFVQVPIAYSLIPGLQNSPKLIGWSRFRLIAAFGSAMVLASMCLAINSTGIRWLMGSLVSASFVTHLVIMLMPGLLLSQVIGAATTAIMPAASAFDATGSRKSLQDLLIHSMRYTMIVILGGLLVASILMKSIIILWVGTEYEFLVPFTLVLYISVSFQLSTTAAHQMLKGLGELRTVILIYFFGLVVVPIALILIIFMACHTPYIATVIGLAVGHLICGVLQVKYCAKTVKADMRQVLARVYVQPIVVAFIVGIIVLYMVNSINVDGLFREVIVSIMALLLFFGGCYLFIFTSEEQRQVREIIQITKDRIISNKNDRGQLPK